jgi:hypothetical protein
LQLLIPDFKIVNFAWALQPSVENPIVLQFNNLTMRKFTSLLLLSAFLSLLPLQKKLQFLTHSNSPKLFFTHNINLLSFDGLVQQARIGEPMLPYQAVKVFASSRRKSCFNNG